MKLKLTRPIAFFDLEATGLNVEEDRIVEIAITRLFPDGTKDSTCRRINPQMPIPTQATEIHGISDEDVADMPKFYQYAKGILDIITGCDIGTFNGNNYDNKLLYHEFLRCSIEWDYGQHHFVDVGNIFKRKEERTLKAAYKFYCDKELDGAHSADADTEATVDVLLSQLERYEDLPDTVEQLALYSNYDNKMLDISGKFAYDKDGDVIFTFGQNTRGQKVKENVSMLYWMSSRSFAPDTLQLVQQFIEEFE